MRLVVAALLLASCSPDLGDLDESTKPNKVKYCTELAQMNGAQGAVYDNDAFLRCMYGTGTVPDGGVHD